MPCMTIGLVVHQDMAPLLRGLFVQAGHPSSPLLSSFCCFSLSLAHSDNVRARLFLLTLLRNSHLPSSHIISGAGGPAKNHTSRVMPRPALMSWSLLGQLLQGNEEGWHLQLCGDPLQWYTAVTCLCPASHHRVLKQICTLEAESPYPAWYPSLGGHRREFPSCLLLQEEGQYLWDCCEEKEQITLCLFPRPIKVICATVFAILLHPTNAWRKAAGRSRDPPSAGDLSGSVLLDRHPSPRGTAPQSSCLSLNFQITIFI